MLTTHRLAEAEVTPTVNIKAATSGRDTFSQDIILKLALPQSFLFFQTHLLRRINTTLLSQILQYPFL